MDNSYLTSVIQQFNYYKSLGDKTFIQLKDEDFFWLPTEKGNSLAIIVKHIAGNMKSRWTNFLTEDGEKKWRNRDNEFIDSFKTKEEIIAYWEMGWECLFKTIKQLTKQDLETIIYIRNQGHTVTEAINRQLCHYSYHVGQIVFLSKIILGEKWESLSIAKGNSKDYNTDKFSKQKKRKHFTEDL